MAMQERPLKLGGLAGVPDPVTGCWGDENAEVTA